MNISYSLQNNRYADQWGTEYINASGLNDGYDGEQDAAALIQVSTVTKQKANTIVINGTDYGLDVIGDDEYRYSADDQLYLFYLNCSSVYGHFVQGLNVVLLPRALALASQVNSTLANLQGIGQNDPLNGATFARTNASRAEASGHVIAVISKNLTGAKAEELLSKMTHNATGGRIGNNVTMPSTESLYLLHLPSGVLAMIPWLGVSNSGMGGQPHGSQSFWEWLGNSIVDIVRFVWNGLVAGLTFMRDLGYAIIDFGLKVLCTIASAYATAVKAVVDAIVDAFMAFVDWVIELVGDLVNAVFSPIVKAITDAAERYRDGVDSALSNCIAESKSTGSISSASMSKVCTAFFSDLFWILMGICTLVSIVLTVVLYIANIVGFIIGLAITAIVSVLAISAIGMTRGDVTNAQSESESYSESVDSSGTASIVTASEGLVLISSNGAGGNAQDKQLFWAVSTIFAWHGFIAAMIAFFGYEDSGMLGLTSLTFGIIGVILAFESVGSDVVGFWALLVSAAALIFGCWGAITCRGASNTGGMAANAAGGILGVIGIGTGLKSVGWV